MTIQATHASTVVILLEMTHDTTFNHVTHDTTFNHVSHDTTFNHVSHDTTFNNMSHDSCDDTTFNNVIHDTTFNNVSHDTRFTRVLIPQINTFITKLCISTYKNTIFITWMLNGILCKLHTTLKSHTYNMESFHSAIMNMWKYLPSDAWLYNRHTVFHEFHVIDKASKDKVTTGSTYGV